MIDRGVFLLRHRLVAPMQFGGRALPQGVGETLSELGSSLFAAHRKVGRRPAARYESS